MSIARSRPKRVWRFCAGTLYAAAVIGLLWLAASRWNGVPADPEAAPIDQTPPRIPLDPALDRSAELLAALKAIPSEPMWTLPPPPLGMRWAGMPSRPIEPGYALDGDWTPETRPHLQAVISFIESEPVQDALDRLARIEPGGCRIPPLGSDLRRACKLFAARARYQHTGRQNVNAAIDDLLAVLPLSTTCYNSANSLMFLVALACESLSEGEMQRLAFERHLTRAQARRITKAIETTVPSVHVLWQYQVETELDKLQRALDASYAADKTGNGWLVLSRFDSVLGGPQPSGEPRLGLWNMLSPLFNDRRTVAAKIDWVRQSLQGIDRLPYKDA